MFRFGSTKSYLVCKEWLVEHIVQFWHMVSLWTRLEIFPVPAKRRRKISTRVSIECHRSHAVKFWAHENSFQTSALVRVLRHEIWQWLLDSSVSAYIPIVSRCRNTCWTAPLALDGPILAWVIVFCLFFLCRGSNWLDWKLDRFNSRLPKIGK